MGLFAINHITKLPASRLSNCNYHAILSFGKNYTTSIVANGEQIESEKIKQPEFIEHRLKLWDNLKTEHDDILAAKPNEPIKIKLQYGRVYEGRAWQSTPNQVYKENNKYALKQAIVAKVNNELWDLNRPLESDCQLELLTFENPLAKQVLWHSAAHMLGSALETMYGCMLNTGPATNNGFFYDIDNDGKAVSLMIIIFICARFNTF